MRILQVASELYPFVKTGGLGDVMAALPPALATAGADVRLLLPGYPALLDSLEGLTSVADTVGYPAGLRLGRVPRTGILAYLIDAPGLFDRPGNPYLGPDGRDWPDNHRRFALLGAAAAALASGRGDPRWQPDLVHAHDWHAGLVPAYVGAQGSPAASVFTIHNLAFQGLFARERFGDLGLPDSFFSIDGLEYYGQVSFMKAGLQFADRITTVSPTYAEEIQTPAWGFGLDGLLRSRRAVLSGILNGADYEIWSPESDPALPRPFDATNLSGKADAKAALQQRLGLAVEPGRLLFGAVTRLTGQKGFDLVLNALPEILGAGGQLAMLGSGDAAMEQGYRAVAERLPEQVRVTVGFDERLAHAIVGGCDMMLVPSRFEPCGLTQIYAMRYGTLPLVRRVGGLADTVVDADDAGLANGTASGVAFEDATVEALMDGIRRGFRLFAQPEVWRRLQRQAMAANFSWEAAAGRYLDLYRVALAARGQTGAIG